MVVAVLSVCLDCEKLFLAGRNWGQRCRPCRAARREALRSWPQCSVCGLRYMAVDEAGRCRSCAASRAPALPSPEEIQAACRALRAARADREAGPWRVPVVPTPPGLDSE